MGVYVHIPFCARKCYYCDFYSVVVGDQEQFSPVVDNYLSALRQEVLHYQAQGGEQCFTTLFLGGGTPSLLPGEKLAALIEFFRAQLPFSAEPEITLEANPHSLIPADLKILRGAGVNRVSLGAQAFQDKLLSRIGRVHRADQIESSLELLFEAGIVNVNLDLMYGLPDQNIGEWEETLREALRLSPTHLSCYALTLEEGTPMARWQAAGLISLPDDDYQAEMYDLAREILRGAGYEHYEISNFCRPGYAARHNLLYWHNRPFLALGAGAVGYLNRVRYSNRADLQSYMENWSRGLPDRVREEQVPLDQEMDETMMVGMRLLEGVSEQEFRQRYGRSFLDVYKEEIKILQDKGLVKRQDGFLRVTERGLHLENTVSGAFLR